MSWNRSREDERSSGSGLATGLVAAAGIAGAGFLLYKLFSEDKKHEETPRASSSFSRREETPRASSSFSRRESNSSFVNVDYATQDVLNQKQRYGTPRDARVEIIENHCTQCRTRKQDVLLEPCNHSLCEDCAEEIDDNCPICYKVVTTTKPNYL